MKRSPVRRPLRVLNRLMCKHPQSSEVQRFLGLSPSTPPHHRRSDHLPRFAEAAAGPEDVIFVLVAAPVLVGRGSTTSAVLCEGGGGINISGKKEECSLEDPRVILPRVIHDESNILIIKDSDRFPGTDKGYFFPSTSMENLYR